MSKVWIDLTDIELWAGHHGGTQRVVYGIAKNFYLENSTDVRFFTYIPTKNDFFETSFKPIYDRVESLKSQKALDNAVTISLKSRLKAKLLPYVPLSFRKNKLIKARAVKAMHLATKIYRTTNNMRLKFKPTTSKGDTLNVAVFNGGDKVLILGKPWDQPGLQTLLDSQKANVNFKVVQVVYDLIISLYPHLHHPTLFDSYTKQMFKMAQSSDLVLPISESSKNDLIQFCQQLNLPAPSAKVIRLGDELDNVVAEKPDIEALSSKFVLCVGTIENRKNHSLLYNVYKLAAERGIDLPQLVIVGGNGWLADDVRYLIANDASVKGKIVILSNISDSSLAWMYKNCLFTIYPSLYEGWGLPVAESLAYGKACVSSNISSMPEIGGELVAYFSPNSTDECLAAIIDMSDDLVRARYEQLINATYKKTTWHDTYMQVSKYMQKI